MANIYKGRYRAMLKNMEKNRFILDCLKELGFDSFLGKRNIGKRNIFVRYDCGWDYTIKITLLEDEGGFYTYFNLESSYNGSSKIIGGKVPYNKSGVKAIFDIAQLPLAFIDLKGKGWGIR
tara:strand:- start:167 stop:529 length:363 start_codon:yes stop_codon:yes gene_type:complete